MTRAIESRDRTEFAKVQEAFALAYLEAVSDKYLNTDSEILSRIISNMNANGYTARQGATATGDIDRVTAISLKDVEGNETSLGTSKTKEIEIEFTESTEISGETPYYVLADGKYYEIIKNTAGDFELATTETPANIVTNGETPKTYSVKVSSSNSDSVGVSYNSTTKKITLTSGASTTESPVTITIRYEDEDGNAKFTPISLVASVSNAVTVADILNQTFATTADKTAFYQGFYGCVVTNYAKTIDTSLNDQWKIFYAGTMGDETEAHIYLIADCYVKYSTLPTKTVSGTTYSFMKNTDLKVCFGSEWRDGGILHANGMFPAYRTGSMIDSNYATVAEIKKLNYDYFNSGFFGTDQCNMRAVAIMLDTNIWSSFMDSNGKAKYSIGGPTVEMLMKSYNDSHGTDYGTKATGETGYKITKTVTTDSGWATSISKMISKTDTNKLYVSENTNTNAEGYWVASPSNGQDYYMMEMWYNGMVSGQNCTNSDVGFRPIVCLNSDVELERQENGTYIIK